MKLIIDGEYVPSQIKMKVIEDAAILCLEHENVLNELVEISLTFVDENEIKEINKSFRNVDSVTDVLSFPQYEKSEDIPKTGLVPIGDVVICIDRAKEQAIEYGHSFERELVYLFVHSMFHLLGYDHMEENEKIHMRKAEEDIMASLRLERL